MQLIRQMAYGAYQIIHSNRFFWFLNFQVDAGSINKSGDPSAGLSSLKCKNLERVYK
jgi:hypothetical protein